jgi:hypothetical protein
VRGLLLEHYSSTNQPLLSGASVTVEKPSYRSTSKTHTRELNCEDTKKLKTRTLKINLRCQLKLYLRLVDEQVVMRRQQLMMLLRGSLERG